MVYFKLMGAADMATRERALGEGFVDLRDLLQRERRDDVGWQIIPLRFKGEAVGQLEVKLTAHAACRYAVDQMP